MGILEDRNRASSLAFTAPIVPRPPMSPCRLETPCEFADSGPGHFTFMTPRMMMPWPGKEQM